jgi:hypothetical protein
MLKESTDFSDQAANRNTEEYDSEPGFPYFHLNQRHHDKGANIPSYLKWLSVLHPFSICNYSVANKPSAR